MKIFAFTGHPHNNALQTFPKFTFGLIGNHAGGPRWDHGGTTLNNRRSTPNNRRSTANHAVFFHFFHKLTIPHRVADWFGCTLLQYSRWSWILVHTQPINSHENSLWLFNQLLQLHRLFPHKKLCQSIGLCLTRTLLVDHTTNMV